MMLVINGLLGEEYRIIKEQISTDSFKNISFGPSFWSWQYVSVIIKALTVNKEWLPFYECINHFITALPFAIKKQRKYIQLAKLFALVDEKLAAGTLNGRALTFAQVFKARENDILQAWDIGEQKIAAGIKAPRE